MSSIGLDIFKLMNKTFNFETDYAKHERRCLIKVWKQTES
jgi:hypothetical protein